MAWQERTKCECGDPNCPVHKGEDECGNMGMAKLYRIDMEDRTGTNFCRRCAQDAYESGLFSDSPNPYSL